MSFRAQTLLLITFLVLLLGSCARTSDILTAPDASALNPAPSTADGALQNGHNLLGYWEISVDSDKGICEAVPVRAAGMHLNVLTWLEYGPCTDCLQITNLEILPNHDLQIDITLIHPFTLPNLTGFDVRGIAMFLGDEAFPELGMAVSSNMEDNYELVNADGHTTLYNPGTVGNGFQGYLKGKMAPAWLAPDAILNGFKVYYTDENRHYFLAGDTLTEQFLIRPAGSVFTFGYAVDASWAPPTAPVTVPDSFPLEANCPEAYKIEAQLSNQLALTAGATTNLIVDVYDWQGDSTIDTVHVEAPYFFSGLVEMTADTGGPGTKRFTCELVNEFGYVGPGKYPVLIRVLDTSSVPGALIDNIAWLLYYVPVIINHPPTCAADVSNMDPDPMEVIIFTDTSTDPEGPTDLNESLWDFDFDGDYEESGFVANHSWDAPGVYYVNHKIIDMAGAEDELDEPIVIDVGLFITLEEDEATKTPGTSYKYQAMDDSYTSGAIIDVDDTDGPWDFTTIGLNVTNNRLRILDDEDSEVAGFKDDFNAATTHFVKYEDMFDPFFPVLYQAEYHHYASNKLFIYGFHDPWVIGSSPFGPPDTIDSLAIPYPLDINTDYEFIIDEPGFDLDYKVKAIGQGEVTVPYGGGTTYDCLLVRYRFKVSSADPVNGATLNFAFIADNGLIVANVIAVNDPPAEYNWNTSTDKINSDGDTLFQALHLIQDE